MALTYYIPVAGTWGVDDAWVVSDTGLFTGMMLSDGMAPLRATDKTPIFNWDSKLNGLWWTGSESWTYYGIKLADLLEQIPFEFRNLIAHSHGGNVALNAANVLATRPGLPRIRTLTTVGTPVRADINARGAAEMIDFWQHICDARWDWMGTLKHVVKNGPTKTLGKIGDGAFSLERRFLIPGVTNILVKDIYHSEVLNDPVEMRRWIDDGWNYNIKNAGGKHPETNGDNGQPCSNGKVR